MKEGRKWTVEVSDPEKLEKWFGANPAKIEISERSYEAPLVLTLRGE